MAYQQADFAWELELTVARHGERPWQVCHVDHTPLDIHLVHSQTARPMGRPYATFLTDAFSRRLLAVSLTYDEPSYRSCYLVLLECVRRWSRLPDTIVVDGGSEFRSLGFETVAAACGMTIRQRPVAAARHGSVVERLFGSSNTQFVHNLVGTTAIARKPRQLTRRHDPARLAIWTLADLDEAVRTWAYEVYDTAEHPALGESPRAAWLTALERAGTRQAGVHALSLEDFRLLAMPSTPKGTATVTHQGLQVNSLLYQGLDIDQLKAQVATAIEQGGTDVLKNLVGTLAQVGGMIVDIVLALVISLYLLVDRPRFGERSLAIIPPQHRAKALFLQDNVSRVLGGYLRAQLTLAVIIGVLSGVGTALLGLPYAVVLGLLAGLFQLVPLFGPILSVIPAVLVALFLPFPTVVWVILFFLVVQQVENNVLAPSLSGHAVGLHPLGALFALLAGFQLAGLLGGLFAVPLAGVLWVLIGAGYRNVVGQPHVPRRPFFPVPGFRRPDRRPAADG